MFNLENAIQTWKRRLRSNPAFEDGDIAELESHLREEVERLKVEGFSEEEAFNRASEEIGEPEPIGDELGMVRQRKRYTDTGNSFLNLGLLQSYLNISLRGLKRNKGFSIINILGLAVGIWACLAIYLVIRDDLSYDRFHEKADRINRVENVMYLPDEGEYMHRSRVPITWAKALKDEIPEIGETARIMASGGDMLFRLEDDRSFHESNYVYADNEIFEIFTFRFLMGDEREPLKRPNTAVLTGTFARKYFGNDNPIGKTIISEVGWYGPVEYEVTAVVEDLPPNSHFNRGIFLSFSTVETQLFVDINQNWNIHFYYTYLLLEPQADREAFTAKLDQFVDRHYDEEQAARYEPEMIALTDIYLHGKGEAQLGATGSIKYIYIQAAIALFILLIAVFNFVNLSTAQSIDRAKEVGVRKVLGADRFSLIRQYLSESVVYCMAATVIAFGLLYITLPSLNVLSGKLLTLNIELLTELLPQLFIGILVVGILAGLYPAVFLSSFRPSAVFKGWSASGDRTGQVRKVLVGFQFTVSVFLIIATMVVYQQLQFLKGRDLGIDREQVVSINLMAREVAENYNVLKNRFMQLSPVSEVSVSSTHFMVSELYYNSYRLEDTPSGPFERAMARYQIDRDYFRTMGIPLLAGELTASFDSDSSGYVVINEAALREAGWEDPEEAIGIRVNYTRPNGDPISAYVAAVSADFHLESPHEQVEPMVMEYWNEGFTVLHVRLSGFDQAHMDQVEQAYKEIYPTLPFEFTFLDDRIDRIYDREDKIGTLFYWFSVLAIVIACMGLFGVAAYAVDRRTKEIGIRKVLGADSLQIVTLLSRDFLGLVTVSFLIASPLAWYAMRQWLNNYTYRIEPGIGLFLLAGLLIVLIALLSISWQSIRAALMNPVESLRSE